MNSRKGATPPKLDKLMLFLRAWEFQPDTGSPELDAEVRAITDALGAKVVLRKPKPKKRPE